MPRLEEIAFPVDVTHDYLCDDPYQSLRNVKRLNAFVGPNNSGKSRFLRSLFIAGKNLSCTSDNKLLHTTVEKLREVDAALVEREIERENLQRQIQEHRFGFGQFGASIAPPTSAIQSLDTLINRTLGYECEIALESAKRSLSAWHQQVESKRTQTAESPLFLKDAISVYVPALRGMRLGFDSPSLGSQSSDMKYAYFDRTFVDYFSDAGPSLTENQLSSARREKSGTQVATGLDIYELLTDRLLGSLEDRNFVRDYEQFLSFTFFQGLAVTLIPRRTDDTVTIKIGSESERPIQHLGDGIQQLIILTLPLFQYRDRPLFLYVEEPELFLHPGYQRIFIDAVTDEPDRQLYVFVTTHSTQFLDITISEEDCSVFRFEKVLDADGESEVEPKFHVDNATLRSHKLLEHIGVRPSSLLLANCTIWVEGITDRLYLKRYIDLLAEESGHRIVENLHYAFVEYGGSSITHWSFLSEDGIDVERVCSKLMLVADCDEGKDQRHSALAGALDDRYLKLPVREIENLLTPDVITKVIHGYEGDDAAINTFEQDDYREVYLGKFIDDDVLLKIGASKRLSRDGRAAYSAPSGTLKDKVAFCRKAVGVISTVEDISEPARETAGKLLQFIVEENGLADRCREN